MSIWDLSGAELSREIGLPAPVTVLRGGHTPGLADVLALVTGLSANDRAALAKALKPETKRISGGMTFKGFDDFMPEFTAARIRAVAAHGMRWHLNPDARICARLPAAWVVAKGLSGTYRSPRDVAFPQAPFWPGAELPNGPEYEDLYVIDPDGDVRTVMARQNARRTEVMRDVYPTMAAHLAFELEPPPDGEMEIAA